MNEVHAYSSPQAFRQALTDKLRELREAVCRDIGDWFTFELGPGRAVATDAAVRIPVTAYVGTASWDAFHVDLVGSDLRMTGRPTVCRHLPVC